jgi:predicted Zn-dependent protease
MSPDSSGRAQISSWKVTDVDGEALGKEAIHKAEQGREPRQVEPGEYAVVFDPYVTEDMLFNLSLYGMGARAVLDGRSWMNGLIGEKAMDARVSIWDDGRDPAGIPLPFDYEGVPKQRVEIVSSGVVKGPVYDRYTAHKAGTASTGHALPPNVREYSPLAINLFMAPGDSSVEEMIRTTERGLYITRFWYTRLAHPRGCVMTGMTRDGVFMIENGELAYPVKNLRFTQAYVEALNSVEAIGRQTRLLTSAYGLRGMSVPALKLSCFNFTGMTV